MSRATKATGNNPDWYRHPETGKGKLGSIEFSQVENLKFENSTEETIHHVSNISYNYAKLAELKSWKQNNVYHEVPFERQDLISSRWVCSLKHNDSGIIPKTRLVVKGFEDSEKDHLQKKSPTCLRGSLRVIISLSVQQKWSLHAIDIKTASLQGKNISRDIYVIPPKEEKQNLFGNFINVYTDLMMHHVFGMIVYKHFSYQSIYICLDRILLCFILFMKIMFVDL